MTATLDDTVVPCRTGQVDLKVERYAYRSTFRKACDDTVTEAWCITVVLQWGGGHIERGVGPVRVPVMCFSS